MNPSRMVPFPHPPRTSAFPSRLLGWKHPGVPTPCPEGNAKTQDGYPAPASAELPARLPREAIASR